MLMVVVVVVRAISVVLISVDVEEAVERAIGAGTVAARDILVVNASICPVGE